MKNLTELLLALSLLVCMFSGCANSKTTKHIETPYKVAFIEVFENYETKSENPYIHDACKVFCEEYGIPYESYLPAEDMTSEHIATIEQAIADGCNVIVASGSGAVYGVGESVLKYPDVKFIATNMYEWDLQETFHEIDEAYPSDDCDGDEPYNYPENCYLGNYNVQYSGFLAGYAAVKLGYERLGIYDYSVTEATMGFMQGVDYAAAEENKTDAVSVSYVHNHAGCDCSHDEEIPLFEQLFNDGTEVVFAPYGASCVAEAAKTKNGKVIGVDIVPSDDIFMTTIKNCGFTAKKALEELILNDNWASLGGKVVNFGIVSDTPEENHVILDPTTIPKSDSFTKDDYANIIKKIHSGEVIVSDEFDIFTDSTVNLIDCGTV